MQNQQLQQHIHVQKQLHDQIKRVKSNQNDDQIPTQASSSSLKNLIQNNNYNNNSSNLTKIYANSNLTK